MGFTFRKRIKLIKGVHLNLSETGSSVSVGVKGLRVTRGRGRTTVSAGVPGTGVGYRKTVSNSTGAPVSDGEAAPQSRTFGGLTGWLLRALSAAFALTALFMCVGALAAPAGSGSSMFVGVLVMALLAWWLWSAGGRLIRRQ